MPVFFGPCDNETQSRADKIRRMSDEELASVLVRYEGTVKRTTVYGGHEHRSAGRENTLCSSGPNGSANHQRRSSYGNKELYNHHRRI